jgi:hypothetical protein
VLPVVLMLLACAIGDQGFPAMNLTLELAAMRHELAKGVPYRYVIVYLHELAPPYANHGLGPARASNLAPLGGLVRAGVPFSLHSDAYMAPAEPLTLAWVAANRIASDGRVWGEGQRVPPRPRPARHHQRGGL